MIVLSAKTDLPTITSALSPGACAFVTKSINPDDIPSALRQAYEETVYHAIGLEPSVDDELAAAADAAGGHDAQVARARTLQSRRSARSCG